MLTYDCEGHGVSQSFIISMQYGTEDSQRRGVCLCSQDQK